MEIVTLCTLITSLSFFAYSVSYFIKPHIKNEFKRFQLESIGLLTIILQIVGAIGLLVGLVFNTILMLSSLGLALIMFSGLMVRLKLKDSIWVSLPAFLLMILNAFIFWESIN